MIEYVLAVHFYIDCGNLGRLLSLSLSLSHSLTHSWSFLYLFVYLFFAFISVNDCSIWIFCDE